MDLIDKTAAQAEKEDKVKNILVVLICLLSVSGTLYAGGSAESGEKVVAVCTPYMSSVTTKQDVDILTEEFENAGIDVSVFDSANDLSRLASDIETAAVSAVDAIVIVSVDPNLVAAQIEEAADAGIPVFGVDAGFIDSMQMNATSDNYQMGVQMCEYLFGLMGNDGKFFHITHRPQPSVVQRTLAMIDELPKYPDVELIAEYHCDVPNQINNAKDIVENILAAYPEKGSFDAIFCAWDEPAIGATQALMEAGRDEVIVVGVDGNEQAVQLINQRTNFKATLAQDFEGMSRLCAGEVIKFLNGEETLSGSQYVPALLITAEE